MRSRWLAPAIALGVMAWGIPPAQSDQGGREEEVFEVEVVAEAESASPGSGVFSRSVITQTEIERSGAQNLMDLLVREAGVWVNRQGGMGYGGNVSIRGFGGSPPTRLAVMLDGHPTQMGIMGHILPTSYLLDNVKRIEILRGPAGARYGDMAIGGVINIVTRGPWDEERTAAMSTTAGSFDTAGAQFWVRGVSGASGYRAQLGRYRTDGDNPFAGYNHNYYALAIDRALKHGWHMAFRSQRVLYTTYDQREVANAYAAGRPARFIEQDYDRGDYDLEFKRVTDGRELGIKLYRTQGEHEFEDGFHSRDFGQGLQLWQTQRLTHGRAEWGLHWRALGGNVLSMGRTFSRDERAIYAMFDVAAGPRADVSIGLRHTSLRDFGHEVLPHFGLSYELGGHWVLFSSARRGYRAPSFRELFLFGINNPDLQPERAWQYEVGARRLLPSGAQLEIALFRIDAEDLVVLRPRPAGIPGPPVRYANAQEATRKGVEIGGRWPAGRHTAWYASFSYLDPGLVKEQTVGRKLCAGVDRRFGDWLVSADLEWVGRLFNYNQNNQLVEVPSFVILNLKASRRLTDTARLAVVVENVFDRTYWVDPAYPYPMPGRSVRFEVEKLW